MNINDSLNKCSLGTQLTVVFVLVFLLVITTLGVFDYKRQLSNLKSTKLNSITSISTMISAAIREDIYGSDYKSIELKLLGLNDIEKIQSVTLYDTNNVILAELHQNSSNTLTPTYRYGHFDNLKNEAFSGYNSDGSLTVRSPITFSGRPIAWIELMSSNKDIQQNSANILFEIVFFSTVILIITSFTIIIFLKVRLRPLHELAEFSRLLPLAQGNAIEINNASPEIKALTKSISWASQEIQKQHEELSTQNQTLEERVAERTSELKLAKDTAEQANMAKAEFLSHMSHELRTPLNAILGFGQLLHLDSENFNEVQRGNIDEILQGGHYLLSLVNELLDLSKIESGTMEIDTDDVLVDKLVTQSISFIQNQAADRQIEIINNIHNTGLAVRADATRLKQVLLNILSNAAKYNREKGRITLDYKPVNNQRLRISITDTGVGISNLDIEKIFMPFERLDTTNNVDGIGIGLVITKHLVELMGGAIGVESKPGTGSTFWVEFRLSNVS